MKADDKIMFIKNRTKAKKPIADLDIFFLLSEIDRLKKLYNELIFAVGNKYPDETRHQTALRYILSCEQSPDEAEKEAMEVEQ